MLKRIVCVMVGHRWVELGRWKVVYRRDRCERCGLIRQMRYDPVAKWWELMRYEERER